MWIVEPEKDEIDQHCMGVILHCLLLDLSQDIVWGSGVGEVHEGA
jgi:hypothetical protein